MRHRPGQVWQPREGRKEPAHPFPINHPALLAHITREQIERADCRDVCLCARHADLRPASRVDNAIRDSSSLRSEEHTSELQSPYDLVCRLLLEKKNAESEPAARTR